MAIRMYPLWREAETFTVPPRCENFTAFDNRLVITCIMRSLSTFTTIAGLSGATTSVTPYLSAKLSFAIADSSINTFRLVGHLLYVVILAPAFSRSKISSTNNARRLLFAWAILTRDWTFSGSLPNTPASIRPSAPFIDVSGVRNSWLTVEMNSDLALSTTLRSLMSREIATKRAPASSGSMICKSTSTGICFPSAFR